MLRQMLKDTVTLVRPTLDGDIRTEVHCKLGSRKATFEIDVDVEEGDLIEQEVGDSRIRTYRVVHVTYYRQPTNMAHVAVEHEHVAAKPPVAARRVDIANLHPDISAAAGALFADQHYSRAVFAAFQALEHDVQSASGSSSSGVSLMHEVFSSDPPKIDVARHAGPNAKDEREGIRFLFVGASQGIRDPRGHGDDLPDTAEEALEYLALASLLRRRLP